MAKPNGMDKHYEKPIFCNKALLFILPPVLLTGSPFKRLWKYPLQINCNAFCHLVYNFFAHGYKKVFNDGATLAIP